jgi:phage terminase large subunit
VDNIERARIWQASANDLALQTELKKECAEDIIFWIECFVSTYDPRESPPDLPFDLYPFQVWALTEWQGLIETQEDFLTEKTRDMGVTWMILLLFLHGWLFKGYDFLIGSRTEDYVDTLGDMSTHFPKLRYALYHLPRWMLPTGFNPKRHDNYMKLINPELNNTITGESSNPSFARGGRYRAVFFDEFAFWGFAEAAWVSASHSTKCRIPVSTPHGKANKFAKLSLDKTNERFEPVLHESL